MQPVSHSVKPRPETQPSAGQGTQRQRGGDHRGDESAGGALPRFTGREERRHFVLANRAAGEVGAGVTRFHDGDHRQQRDHAPAAIATSKRTKLHAKTQQAADVGNAEHRPGQPRG